MVDTSVKYFHSKMPGAPVLNGQAGSLIAVLQACLVDGFGQVKAESVVISNGIATINVSSGHSAEVNAVILLNGATPAVLNGEQRAIATTQTTITFAVPGIADQNVTGNITVKLAPGGWSKPFSGNNTATFQSLSVKSTKNLVCIDDTAGIFAKVMAYEAMSAIDVGMNPYPSMAQRTNGLFWAKSSQANNNARKWFLATDGLIVHFVREISSDYLNTRTNSFGDIISLQAGDAYHFIVNGDSNNTSEAWSYSGSDMVFSSSNPDTANVYCARSYTTFGGSCALIRWVARATPFSGGDLSGAAAGFPFPNAVDGGFYVTPMLLIENNTKMLRGSIPGIQFISHNLPQGTFNFGDRIDGVSSFQGHMFFAYPCGSSNDSGGALIDISGPWR